MGGCKFVYVLIEHGIFGRRVRRCKWGAEYKKRGESGGKTNSS